MDFKFSVVSNIIKLFEYAAGKIFTALHHKMTCLREVDRVVD